MSKDIEMEKTYLVKFIPSGLEKCDFVEILDLFIPASSNPPKLRIRKKGEKIEITKKIQISDDYSEHEEHTIPLTFEEFEVLSVIPSKRLRKLRYFYPVDGLICELDIFQDDLEGLVVAEFEFIDRESLEKFSPPDFCLVDVTEQEFMPGGLLAGKTYSDIEEKLKNFGYTKITS